MELNKLPRLALRYCGELLKMPVRIRRLAFELSQLQEQLRLLQLQQCAVPEEVERYDKCRRYSSAIMTVMIIPENVMFLDEWIEHHLGLGIDHIVIYDNSKSRYNDHWERGGRPMGFDGETTNKHRVNYQEAFNRKYGNMHPGDVFRDITAKYSAAVSVVEWSRTDNHGRVCYFQLPAIKHFIFHNRQTFDYMFAIDADEFIHSDCGWLPKDLFHHMEERNVTSGLLGQRRFLNRFASLDTPVKKIPWCYREDYPGFNFIHCKTVLRLRSFIDFHRDLRSPHTIPTAGFMDRIPPEKMRFHHYQVPFAQGKYSLLEFSDSDLLALERCFIAT